MTGDLARPDGWDADDDQAVAYRAGRMTLLTEDVHKAIVAALRSAATDYDAAQFAGVSLDRLREWCRIGEEYDRALDDPATTTDAYAEGCRRLFLDVRQARSVARVRAGQTLVAATTDAPWATRVRAAMFLLERTSPDGAFSEKRRVELTGGDGGPIEVEDVTDTRLVVASRLRQRIRSIVSVDRPVEDDDVTDAEVVDETVTDDADDDDDPYIGPIAWG